MVSTVSDANLCRFLICGQDYFFVSHSVLPHHFTTLISLFFSNPRVEFICRIAVIWLHLVVLDTDAQLFL
jgi:hypothetical protein